MSISRLPNGRLRVQVYDPATGRSVSAAKVLGLQAEAATFPDTKLGRREAIKLRERARDVIAERHPSRTTVRAWARIWTTDPLWERPKESTNIYRRERIKGFVETYGHLLLDEVTDAVVSEWRTGAKNNSTIPSLRSMFNDAASLDAGRLVKDNPFARLKIRKGSGNAEKDPPTEKQVWNMISIASKLGSPMFAGWLQTACFTGMRPGELDGLKWTDVDLESGRIRVERQFSAATRTMTTPKNGKPRVILLPPEGRSALLAQPQVSEFCFVNMRGAHFTPSSRAYPWKAIRAKAGLEDKSLYLCSRHFAGWYMVNVLEMESEDVAIQLGHRDGGDLVRRLYGHRDHGRALQRLEQAFESRQP